MKSGLLRLAVLWCAVVQIGIAQTRITQTAPAPPVLKGFPFTNESLSYTVTWPSGLSIGEGHLSAASGPAGWRFELALDAGIPGFTVKDTYISSAGAGDLCSASLSKDSVHGTRKRSETVSIDKSASTATRHSNYGGDTGGTSKITVPDCIHDALTFLFYARRELGQGRVPPPQEIIFGAVYDAALVYAGAETITLNDRHILTDKMVCHIRGPASDIQFDAYFDRDAARTPVAVRVPLPIGKISLELVR
jgi:hypothetical protein